VAPIIGLGTFLNGKSYVLIISKNELGDILGDFFKNAFFHPGQQQDGGVATQPMHQYMQK
jgi:hypothetical protein